MIEKFNNLMYNMAEAVADTIRVRMKIRGIDCLDTRNLDDARAPLYALIYIPGCNDVEERRILAIRRSGGKLEIFCPPDTEDYDMTTDKQYWYEFSPCADIYFVQTVYNVVEFIDEYLG